MSSWRGGSTPVVGTNFVLSFLLYPKNLPPLLFRFRIPSFFRKGLILLFYYFLQFLLFLLFCLRCIFRFFLFVVFHFFSLFLSRIFLEISYTLFLRNCF